jgi:hypothetical protein
MTQLEANRVGPRTPVGELAELIRRDGYVIVEQLAPDVVGRAKTELDDWIESSPFGPGNFHGPFAKNVEGLVGKSDAAHRLMIHDTVMALCDLILLPNCVRYQLNYTGIMHLEPGTEVQELHRDGGIYPFRHPHPPTILATMWAGTDFTAENGATRLVPGSHVWDHDRKAREDDVIAAAMPAGSVLFYIGGVVHGGGANTANSKRTGIAIQYSLGWLRQEENLHLAVSPDLARTLPDRLARLVGYEFGGPFMGFVNGDDPHRLIEDVPLDERCHSRPDLDTASRQLQRFSWGNVQPESTPEQ